MSRALLAEWGILCYSMWESGCAPLHAYLDYVNGSLVKRCVREWRLKVALHTLPILYTDLATAPSVWPAALLRRQCCWDALLGHVALVRLRAGLIEVSHIGGCRSRAEVRVCIGCGLRCRAPLLHALSACPRWTPDGVVLYGKCSRIVATQLLCASADSDNFVVAARLATRIEQDVRCFWATGSLPTEA